MNGQFLHFKYSLTKSYCCHPEITRLLSDLFYPGYDPITPSQLSMIVLIHPKAPYPFVFYCSDCTDLAKKAGIKCKETGIKAEQIDAEAVIYQLNYYCRNWPKEWSTFKITDVCVVSADRSQVGKALYSIVSLILIYIYYTIYS